MANPQKENGYTAIANEIFEQFAKYALNGTQWRILVVVWRYTYGFNRKEHELSETFISRCTGIDRRNVRREMTRLIEQNILVVVKEATFTEPRVIRFNKDYDEWMGKHYPQGAKLPPPGENATPPGGELAPSPGGEMTPQERKIKERLKKEAQEQEDLFLAVWDLYPDKRGKGKVSATKKKELFKVGYEQLKRCIERYKRTKEDWKHWMQGSTFFNSGYIDYLDENFHESKEADKRNRGHPEGFEVIR